ncbi:hypothetical protein NQZ68_005731 [Dissostichus eleginoides]|nr:hypothetical protein NQZ68_005731 [Dissostichus eleginoides]
MNLRKAAEREHSLPNAHQTQMQQISLMGGLWIWTPHITDKAKGEGQGKNSRCQTLPLITLALSYHKHSPWRQEAFKHKSPNESPLLKLHTM